MTQAISQGKKAWGKEAAKIYECFAALKRFIRRFFKLAIYRDFKAKDGAKIKDEWAS